MKIFTHHKHGYTIYQFKDIIHWNSNISDLEDLTRYSVKSGSHHIAVMFPQKSSISTMSVSTLVKCAFMVDEAGGQFAVIGPNEELSQLINELELNNVIALVDTTDDLASSPIAKD